MQPQRLVEFGEFHGRDAADPAYQPLGGNGPDLFGLCLGVRCETSRRGAQEDLKRVDFRDSARYRYDGDDATPKARRRGVGAVITHDDSGSPLVGFATTNGIEIDLPNLTALHQ